MNYKKIAMEKWQRAGIFRHFIDDVRCVVCITADMDVTEVLAFCKAGQYRFYPVFLYLVSRGVNRREEFRMGYDENGELIVWNEVSPSYPVFQPEDELFTRLITVYSPNFGTFYQRVLADLESHKDARGHEVVYSERNVFDASCLPWLNYKACSLHVFDGGNYLAPIVTWGRYQDFNGKVTMPLTMQIHHAVADGFHISRFYEDIRAEVAALAVL